MAEKQLDMNALVSEMQSRYSERDEMIDEMRALRDMESAVTVPAGMEPDIVRSPIVSQMTSRMVGMLTADKMGLTVPPADNSDSSQEQSSKLEKWTGAALDELERQADEQVRERLIESMIIDGAGCVRMLYAPGNWKGYPKQKSGEKDEEYLKRTDAWVRGCRLPIAWTWVDTKSVYPEWGEFGLEGMLEVDSRPLTQLARRRALFNVARAEPELWDFDRFAEEQGGLVKFQQYWTPTELTYAIEGVIVHRVKHKYQTPPYAYAFGQTISTKDINKRGRSMVWDVRFLVPYLDRLLSQKATAIRIWSWPTVVVKQSPQAAALLGEDPNKSERILQVSAGGQINLFSDEDVSFLVWQGNGPDADEMLQLVSQFIERAGLSDPAQGFAGGVDSGYAINQLISAARIKYRPLVLHAEAAIENQIRVLWDIVEHMVKQDVYLYAGPKNSKKGWMGLGPSDLKGYRNVRVTLNPLMPTDSYARSSEAMNLMERGVIDRREAMERVGIEQPDEMEMRILIDQYKKSPEITQVLTQRAIKKFGVAIAQEEQKGQGVTPDELATQFQSMPSALQQAIMASQMGGGGQMTPQMMAQSQGGAMPQFGMQGTGAMGPGYVEPANVPATSYQAQMMPGAPQTEAAPGVTAAPGAPRPAPGAGLSGGNAPKLGKRPRPSGVAQGRAPGVKRTGKEG